MELGFTVSGLTRVLGVYFLKALQDLGFGGSGGCRVFFRFRSFEYWAFGLRTFGSPALLYPKHEIIHSLSKQDGLFCPAVPQRSPFVKTELTYEDHEGLTAPSKLKTLKSLKTQKPKNPKTPRP